MVSIGFWITALCLLPSPAVFCTIFEIVKSIPLRTLNGPLTKPASKRICSINFCQLSWSSLQPLEIKVNSEAPTILWHVCAETHICTSVSP